MNKKLVKTRIARRDTLEAMSKCTSIICDCTKCSGGGSWMAQGRNAWFGSEYDHYWAYH